MARNSDMKKAVCWEMVATTKGVEGFRVIVAGQFLLTQTLEVGNERPRWVIEDAGSPAQATQRAVAVTDFVEKEYSAKLAVDPTEVVVHDAELKSLRAGGKIPSALRARVFTAHHRQRTGT